MLSGIDVRRREVSALLDIMISKGNFTMNALKRAVLAFIVERGLDSEEAIGMVKAKGMNVEEMYSIGEGVFECGENELPTDACNLKVDKMITLHCESCDECRGVGLQASCRFWKMSKCIRNGWRAPVNAKEIRPKYKQNTNYPSTGKYSESLNDEINSMKSNGVLREAEAGMEGIISPMSAVIKNSDILRAKTLVKVEIKDQHSLREANEKLKAVKEKKVKTRIAVDLTATGINGSSPTPPFSYPSPQDGLQLVTKDCWLGKTDIERYFYCFPLAQESYKWFMVAWLGIIYYFIRATFGYATCPYYCSTWSAEFSRWLNSRGIRTAHMVDDYLVSGMSKEEVKGKLALVTAMFVLVGFTLAVEKEEIGQRISFLGVVIDTQRMMLSFEAVVARSMLLQLIEYATLIEQGSDMDETAIRSVAGKLQWYSEVLQSGKVHIRSWWLYLKYRKKLSHRLRYKLIMDTKWWIGILQVWAAGQNNEIEYPIVSAAELKSDPRTVVIVTSDASGTDGFGYMYGHMEDMDPSFYSRQWGGEYEFKSSHTGELQALRHYIKYRHRKGSKVLVWITDCLSAMWTVNKGRCREESGLIILEEIFDLCDQNKVQLVALWVPREDNILSDFLSHLSVTLNRNEYEGRSIRNLCVFEGHRIEGGAKKMGKRSQEDRRTISKLVYREGNDFKPSI